MKEGFRGFLARQVSSSPRLKRAAEHKADGIGRLMKRSGRVGNPFAEAAGSVGLGILSAAVMLPTAAFLALEVAPWFSFLSAVPLAVFFLPEARLRDGVAKRAERVDREMPFFSVLVSVLGSAGLPLYAVFEGLASKETFQAMKQEAMMIGRDVRIFGMNPVESFERLAASHPSKKFSEFLTGYSSKVRSGGDLPAYLSGESRSLLQGLEDAWGAYSARAGVIGSLMVTVFGVVPLLLLIVGFFAPSASAVGLLAFSVIGVPLLALALVALSGRMQPASERVRPGGWKLALALSATAAGAASLTGQWWAAAAASMFVFFVAYGATVRKSLREAREVDDAVPRFLKDVVEYRRQEYDLGRAVASIASRTTYTPAFDRVLGRLSTELRAGVPLNESRVDPGTRLARMVFFVLGQMSYSGGGDVDTLFQLTRYAGKVVEMKKAAQSEMKPYLILSYITPVLLVLGVAFVGGILGSYKLPLGSSVTPVLSQGTGGAFLLQASYLLVVVTAGALGVVGAKMTDLTVQNTLRAATNVAVATAAIGVVPLLNLAALFHSAA